VSRQRSTIDPVQPNSLNPSSPTSFVIQLVMSDNSLSEGVCLKTYTDLVGPVGGPDGLHAIMQTVRIPLADFRGVSLAQIRGIRFTFNETATGPIYIANIRLAR